MSELDNAIKKINDAANRADNTTNFYDNVVSGGKDDVFINPNNNKSSKSVKGILDEAYQADKPDFTEFVDQCKAEVVNATDQAGIATTQAESAAHSASEASRISGLDTLASGVGVLSPIFNTPDVLIPFNDGVGIEHGYGNYDTHGNRVIDYSCASAKTSINKSGQLVTPAENEAAIESGGIAIFQSLTNLIKISQKSNWADGSGGSTGTQVANTDFQTKSTIDTVNKNDGLNRRPYFGNTLEIDKTYTVSFRANIENGEIKQLANYFTGAVFPAVIDGKWHTYTFSGVATTTALDFVITGKCEIAYVQCVEGNIPNAPYIPTNGTAVTRAADVAKVTSVNNLPASGKPFYIVADVDFGGLYGSSSRTIFRIGGTPFRLMLSNGNKLQFITKSDSGYPLCETNITKSKLRIITAYNNGLISLYVTDENIKIKVANDSIKYEFLDIYIGTYLGSGEFLNGHIKNLIIKHGIMTDDLAKAYGAHPDA